MMKKLYFIILVLLCGCNNGAVKNSDIESVKPLEQTVEVSDLKDYIDKLEILKLENNVNASIGIVKKLLLSKNGDIYILSDNSIKKFTEKGEFVEEVGVKGLVDDEHLSIVDMCFDLDGKLLYILDSHRKIYVYTLYDGKYLKNIKINNRMDNYDAISPSSNGGFYLFKSNPSDYTYFKTPYYFVEEFDGAGTFLREFMPRKDFVFTMAITTQSCDNSFFIRPQEGDSVLYRISKDGAINPYLRLDFGNMQVPS